MKKTNDEINSNELTLEDYQKLVEKLRVRVNVLNASIFLLEEKLDCDVATSNYIDRINFELEQIRKMIVPYPLSAYHKN
jgi:hypothetical protein